MNETEKQRILEHPCYKCGEIYQKFPHPIFYCGKDEENSSIDIVGLHLVLDNIYENCPKVKEGG